MTRKCLSLIVLFFLLAGFEQPFRLFGVNAVVTPAPNGYHIETKGEGHEGGAVLSPRLAVGTSYAFRVTIQGNGTFVLKQSQTNRRGEVVSESESSAVTVRGTKRTISHEFRTASDFDTIDLFILSKSKQKITFAVTDVQLRPQ